MNDDRLSRLLDRFRAAARVHHEALEAMDEGRANTHARMIAALYEAVMREGDAGRSGLLELAGSDSPAVAGMAAVYAMDIDPETCLAVLRRVAQEPGLLGFRAGVVLEQCEEGSWQPPGKRTAMVD